MKDKKTFKFIILPIFIFYSLLFLCGNVFALEITDYPRIPMLPELSRDSDLGDYVGYIFGLLTYAAGIVAVISFAIGSIQLIMSASNPSLAKEAKDRMKGSLLGLVLTLSAVVILQTINPSLVETTLQPLQGVDGIYYTNGSKLKPAPNSQPNTENSPEDYSAIYYKCDLNSAPILLLWRFPNKNFDYSNGADVIRMKCGDVVSISGFGSFKMDYETAGIYFCLNGCGDEGLCSGYMSNVNKLSGGLEDPFKGKIGGIRIVNDLDRPLFYGVIGHAQPDLESGGTCTPYGISLKESECIPVNIPVFSADIFVWNKNDPDSSGDGISFFEQTYGWDADVESGIFNVSKTTINNISSTDGVFTQNADTMIFDYTGVKSLQANYCNSSAYSSCNSAQGVASNGECCLCPAFRDCPKSIRIKGDYLVALYSYGIYNGGQALNCITFSKKDIENLDAYDYIKSGNKINYVNVIPIK